MERMRTPVLVGSFLIVCGVIAAIALRPSQRAETPYLAESPVSGTRFRLRLLEISDQPIDYRWKVPRSRWDLPPWLSYQLGLKKKDAFDLSDIDIHFPGVVQGFGFINFPATGFLFRFVDERGHWVRPLPGYLPFYHFVESTGWIHRKGTIGIPESDGGCLVIGASSLPRRDPTLRIVVHDRNGPHTSTLTTLETPNPYFRRDFPTWTALPLPQSQTRGDRTVVLHALPSESEVHRYRKRHPFFVSVPHEPYDPAFARASEVSNMYVEDATGNVGSILSPFEPVWKVVAIFDEPWTPQAPDRVHQIGTFPIPQAGTCIPVHEAIPMGKGSVRILCVAGAGTATLGQGQLTMSDAVTRDHDGKPVVQRDTVAHDGPFLWVSLDPTAVDRKMILRHGVSTGEPVETRLTNSMAFPWSQVIPLSSTGATGAAQVEITLIERDCERVEFFVEPPQHLRDDVRTEEYRSAMMEP